MNIMVHDMAMNKRQLSRICDTILTVSITQLKMLKIWLQEIYNISSQVLIEQPWTKNSKRNVKVGAHRNAT